MGFSVDRDSISLRILLISLLVPVIPLVTAVSLEAQDNDRHLWFVTLDGLRPEELFTGVDKRLVDKEIGGVEDAEGILAKYWDADATARRQKLMPFFWSVIARKGQVFGDPDQNSSVMVKNGRYFSYPGYQEILCGFPDDKVDSNDKIHNRNVSVLEWLNNKPDLAGRVAAFAGWDVFPYILNRKRSGLYVNAGWVEFTFVEDPQRKDTLNQAVRETPHYWGSARFDFLTFRGALEYVKLKSPRVLYLALDETDDWCHSGRYDLYLEAAHRADQYLRQLWEYAQSHEHYRNKTSILITTDHGRGHGREGWKDHGTDLPGSERIWIAVMGPDTPALGIRENVQATQGQVAASAAQLLGFNYASENPQVAEPLPGIVTSGQDSKTVTTTTKTGDLQRSPSSYNTMGSRNYVQGILHQ